jgi:hypothetical protein
VERRVQEGQSKLKIKQKTNRKTKRKAKQKTKEKRRGSSSKKEVKNNEHKKIVSYDNILLEEQLVPAMRW